MKPNKTLITMDFGAAERHIVTEQALKLQAIEELRELDCIDSPTLRGAAKQDVKRVLWRGDTEDDKHEWLVIFLANPENPAGLRYGLLLRVKEGWVWRVGLSSDIRQFVGKYGRSKVMEQWPTLVD